MNDERPSAEILKGTARSKRELSASLQRMADDAHANNKERLQRAILQAAADDLELSADAYSQLAQKFAARGPADDAAPLLAEMQQLGRTDERRTANAIELLQAQSESIGQRLQESQRTHLARLQAELQAELQAGAAPRTPRRWHRLRTLLAVLRQIPTITRNVVKAFPAEFERRLAEKRRRKSNKPSALQSEPARQDSWGGQSPEEFVEEWHELQRRRRERQERRKKS